MGVTRVASAALFCFLFGTAAIACPDGYYSTGGPFSICLPNSDTVTRPVKSALEIAQDAADEVAAATSRIKIADVINIAFPGAVAITEAALKTGSNVVISAVQNLEMIATRFDKNTQIAIANAFTNADRATRDAAQNITKSANDIVEAANASVRFAERSIKGTGEVLSKAEERLRDGKVVDALWHLGTDHLQTSNENAAAFMAESEVARQAAQTLAASYGGPAGSAAFAAWYAYNASGRNVEKALLAGVYSYAVGTQASKINAMPSNTISETAKKAASVAAMRGLAVAAAGGSRQDALNAAMQAGGSIIVQSGGAYVSKEFGEPAKSGTDSFCMEATKASCEDAMQWVDDARSTLTKYRNVKHELPNVVVSSNGQWGHQLE